MGSGGVVLVPKVSNAELKGDSVNLNGYTVEGATSSSDIHS